MLSAGSTGPAFCEKSDELHQASGDTASCARTALFTPGENPQQTGSSTGRPAVAFALGLHGSHLRRSGTRGWGGFYLDDGSICGAHKARRPSSKASMDAWTTETPSCVPRNSLGHTCDNSCGGECKLFASLIRPWLETRSRNEKQCRPQEVSNPSVDALLKNIAVLATHPGIDCGFVQLLDCGLPCIPIPSAVLFTTFT